MYFVHLVQVDLHLASLLSLKKLHLKYTLSVRANLPQFQKEIGSPTSILEKLLYFKGTIDFNRVVIVLSLSHILHVCLHVL